MRLRRKPLYLKVEHDQVDQLLSRALRIDLKEFEKDLLLRSDGEGLPIFDDDPVKDVLYIQEHIAAIKLILEFYG